MSPALRRPFSRLATVLALLGAAFAASRVAAPAAQSQAPQSQPQPQRPTFRTEANLVRVDVYADAGERPVLDLRQDEFQVFEDGAPQKVETFEHIVVRPARSGVQVVEPGSVRDANAMAADPHNRVFVIFVDTYHVSFPSAHGIAPPLIRMIDRILGPDDLVGIMTPEMSASGLTLARKTDVIEQGLREGFEWARRNRITGLDPVEEGYLTCYPPKLGELGNISAVAREMIARHREKTTLDSVLDTVRHLNAIREERKAVIAVSEGWTLFRPGSDLLESAGKPAPPHIYKDPLNQGMPELPGRGECDVDRMVLVNMDDERYFRDILDESARANVGFYPVDPRGLVVFDTDIGGGLELPKGPVADAVQLTRHLESLRRMAVATDGIAVVDSNDLDRGLTRVSDDLSSYYLLGYYSTNPALDGRYRRIDVKVTRPGVSLRARRGYRAASEAELAKGTRPETLAAERPEAFEATLASALGSLVVPRGDTSLYLRGVVIPGAPSVAWIEGELAGTQASASARSAETAQVRLTASGDGGASIGSARVVLAAGQRAFVTRMTLDRTAGPSGIQVQAQIAGADGQSAPRGAAVNLPWPDPARTILSAPLLFRGGPGAASAFVPAALPQFRRAETLKAEGRLDGSATVAGVRLLDRNGAPLAVPVRVTERTDEASGDRWLVAELSLAPLAAGDYVLSLAAEQRGTRQEILAAFRVGR